MLYSGLRLPFEKQRALGVVSSTGFLKVVLWLALRKANCARGGIIYEGLKVILGLTPRKRKCTKGSIMHGVLLHFRSSSFRPMRLTITDHTIPEQMDSRAICVITATVDEGYY